jgi:hypothetical protein
MSNRSVYEPPGVPAVVDAAGTTRIGASPIRERIEAAIDAPTEPVRGTRTSEACRVGPGA